ncbi:MAG: Clp protease N-terminal domain-containing protein, partial [Cyanobacteriota bacterium]|nr:Clp protease N-terminal domain-containing protein [Cyanobacteriota bacterium]
MSHLVSAVAHVGGLKLFGFPSLGDKKSGESCGIHCYLFCALGQSQTGKWLNKPNTRSSPSTLIAWSHHCIGPAMFERFTEKAIKVIMLAQEEARRLGHNFVGTEQILLGLIGEGTGVAAKVLKSMGVNLKDARVEVEKIIGRGSGFVAVEIPFTPRAKRVLELSLEEAR